MNLVKKLMINFGAGTMNMVMRNMISKVLKLVQCLFQMLIILSLSRMVVMRKNNIGLNQDGHTFKECKSSTQDGGLDIHTKDFYTKRFQCSGTGQLKLIILKVLLTVIGWEKSLVKS